MNNSKLRQGGRVAGGRIKKIALAIAPLMCLPAFAQTTPTPQAPFFTPGNLVVAVAGCGVYGGTPPNTTPSTATCATPPVGGTGGSTGTGSNSYGDDQGAPWNLWQYTPNGVASVTFVNSLQLPQNISGANYPVSNDYGSQSEGTIQLSGNNQYLTIMGYGINAATFNVNYLNYCPGSTMLSNACVPENGNPALAQTGSLLGQSYSGNTAVPRVAALIDANGNVNSSTVLYNIFNQNDARSAYTPDGVNIYVSGQGCKNWDPTDELCDSASKNYDDTQGVYLTTLGANNYLGTNNPIAISGPDNGPTGCTNTTTCTSSESTRMVQIYNNTLYVSMDDKPGSSGYNRSLIGTLGDPPSTSLFTCTGIGGGCGTGYGPYGPALMPGFGNTGATGKYTINSQGSGNTSNGNNLNNSGLKVNLSPQNFFFASPTVLYVADTGSPKNTSNGADSVCTSDGTTDSATVGDGGLQKWVLNPTVTVSLTKNSTTASASSGAFTQGQVGLAISGAGIPAGTTITAVSSAGANATLSAAATAGGSESVTVSGWSLVYTLYNGLNLVLNSDCDPNPTTSPTAPLTLASTGLYGVTGVVKNGVATLYVTNYPNNDLVQTYLYGITDTLSTMTITSPGTAFTLLDTAPAGSVFRGVSFVPAISNGDVMVTTVPSGLTVTSANTGCAPSTFTTPLTLAWTPGSTCTLSVTTPQAGPTGVQYAFSNWQDGTTSTTDNVTAPSSTATATYTYTATFTTQYQLTTSAGTGGTVSAGGYYSSGTNATITATPSAGYYFVNFTIVNSTGTTTSTNNPLSLPMTEPQSVTANFSAQTTQTITFGALSNQVYGTAPFTVSATASSGLPVSFNSQTTSVCTVSGSTVTVVGLGTCTIQATQAGNTDYAAATAVNQSFQVTQASQTITFGALSNQVYGTTPFTVNASASSGLSVSFASTTPTVCTVSGVLVTLVTTGVCTIQATQAGNADYAAAAPVNQSFEVLPQGLGTTSLVVGSAGGSGSVLLNYSGAWTAASNASFLSVAPASASGTGNALINFTYSPFSGTGSQTGTLTIAGQTLSVTQAGTNYLAPGPVLTIESGLAALTGTAVDSAGDIYFISNGTVEEWSATTQTANALVSSGLSSPNALAVDLLGNVYIADTADNAIKEWNAGTQQVTALVSSGLSGPLGVAVDNVGNVYIADSGNQAIKEWSAATQTVSALVSSGLTNPNSVAVDFSGNVYFSDSTANTISQWNAATQSVNALVSSGINNPSAVAVDGAGDVYFSDSGNQAIKEWSAATQTVTTLVSTGLSSPAGVAVDGLDNVYLADSGNSALKEMPSAYVGPATLTEPAAAGSDALLPVLPNTESLTGIFAPTSDQSWLTIGTITGGVVNFSFAANTTTSALTAHISVLGQSITVTQSGLTAQTITFGALSNQVYGTAPFTVSATASSNLPVSFASTTSSVCTVLGDTVTIVQTGQCTIQATQAGNAVYAPAPSVSQSFQVTPAAQTITFGALSNQVFGVAVFTVSATASSGLPVSFNSQTTSVCTVANSTVTLVNVGTCTIQATQSGNTDYAAAPSVNQSFQVTQAGQTITFGALSNQLFGIAPLSVSATASSGLPVSFATETASVCTVSGTTVALVATGICTIQATQPGNLDYAAAAPVNQSFEVTSQGLGTTSLLFGSAGGSSSVVLAVSGAWTASANASFLHISGGSASGTGNGVVDFTYDPFTGSGSRTGTLTIAGFTLTVTQAGTNYIGPSPVLTLESGLNSPVGTAVDGPGNVYFSDSVLNAVEEWNAATQQLSTLVSGLNQPSGVAVDGLGNVYFADSGNNAIKEWTKSTQQVATLVSGLNNPSGVAVDSAGNVFFADSGNQAIKEWNVATQQVATLVSSGLSNPSGVAVDVDGNVYFSDRVLNVVEEWNAATQTVATLVSSGLNGPGGTAVDGSGNVYFADSGNQAIKEWSPSTQAVSTLVSSGLSSPFGVAVDGLGDVYFADTGNQAIKEILNAYVGPAVGLTEPAAAGSDALLPVLPATASLTGIFAPSSNQSWLTIGTIAGGVIDFSFTANTSTSARVADITVLGQSITVTQSGLTAQTITFGALSNQVYSTPPFSLSATASSGLTVSFNSQTTSVCTVSGTTVTLVMVGQCTIQATQPGNAQYSAATPVNQSFQVTQATPTVSFTGAPASAPYESTFTVTATTNDGTTATITASGSCSLSGTTVTITAPSGTCSLKATWPPNTDYLGASAVQSTNATPATPTINWSTPAPITYGTALSATQLDATATYNGASVAGTFVYTPAKGTVLRAGSQILSVTFTPTNTADYTSATASVILQVNQAVPKITWAKPAAITYGTPLSSKQLDATASVPGTLVYSPPAGTVLTAGTQTLSATFTPTDNVDYATTTDAVTITVSQAVPTLTWATPAPITYGTALSGTQLDASASVAGTFVYSPAAGTIPAGGLDTLKVTFTPTNTTDYATATASVTLLVEPATPTINWSTPAPITYGTALSATQLDATATYNGVSVAGTFVYTPAKGTVLRAGSQTLSVTFIPNNTADYTSANASVLLQVNQATPKITWAKPAAITYPTPLSRTQLDATASVPGTFVYSPAAGTVLSPGTQPLSVTFTPTDTVDYTTATDTVTITVEQ